MKRLHLATVRRLYRDVVARAERDQWTFRDFLAVLVAEEVAHRTQTRVQTFTRNARFPFLKTIDDFDFTLQSTVRAALLGSYLSTDFVTDGRSIIFLGATGRGKTHLAVAIGYRAIQLGFETRFTTAAQLIEDLSNASRHGRLHDALLRYTHPHVLIVDEVGYLSYGPDAANVLYHVVNDRHLRKRPMIFTTNKPLQKWGRVLHDRDLAAAILDRVLERGRVIVLDGPSGRTKHLALDAPAPPSLDGARISGIQPPQFLEPTAKSRFTTLLKGRIGSVISHCGDFRFVLVAIRHEAYQPMPGLPQLVKIARMHSDDKGRPEMTKKVFDKKINYRKGSYDKAALWNSLPSGKFH